MTLAGARIALNASDSIQANIFLRAGKISGVHPQSSRPPLFDLSGFLILPGLINAHDHLDFSLFPRLGRGPYRNATEWARDIYLPREAPIRQHLLVSKTVRLFWGGIKNLLCGVTTVSHHNGWRPGVFNRRFPVRVLQRFGWAHSLHFSPDAEDRFRQTPPGAPFIIHAGEGSDSESRAELVRLDRSGMLTPYTVIVHGTAFEGDDFKLLAKRGVSLVWCPSSNYFTLGRSLAPAAFDSGVPISLGTDSPLTAAGDLIDEICVARRSLPLHDLYEMVGAKAARVLRLTAGEGAIQEDAPADLTVVPDNGQSPAEALADMRPDLVLVSGRIKLLSARMADRLKLGRLPAFESIEVEGRGRYLISCRVSALAAHARRRLGEEFRLAGKRVTC
jgi:cytosine/adenosine deaminase-related metal-dependent hydrolase